MLIGYARISKSDGSQKLDLQIDALVKAGLDKNNIYTDQCSGAKESRDGLSSCLKALRKGDTLVVWKTDRISRSLKHLVNIYDQFNKKEIGIKILSGVGANFDSTTTYGKTFLNFMGLMAELERELIRDRVIDGIQAARARGRVGGAPHKINKKKLEIMIALVKNRSSSISNIAKTLGVTVPSIYRYVSPDGEPRKAAFKILLGKES